MRFLCVRGSVLKHHRIEKKHLPVGAVLHAYALVAGGYKPAAKPRQQVGLGRFAGVFGPGFGGAGPGFDRNLLVVGR